MTKEPSDRRERSKGEVWSPGSKYWRDRAEDALGGRSDDGMAPMARPDELATMAMTMLQTLYNATRGRLDWCDIDLVVSKPEHEVVEYAIAQHWIEASPGMQSVRLTAEGRRALIR
jgi:hypothetical protein